MNIFQKLAAKLFGFEYVLFVWHDSVAVYKVKRINAHLVREYDGKRLFPAGKITENYAKWEPLTSGAKKFYDIERI